MSKPWQNLNKDYIVRYYLNGRTDVRKIETGETVTSHSMSLQDDLKRNNSAGPLFYLFGLKESRS